MPAIAIAGALVVCLGLGLGRRPLPIGVPIAATPVQLPSTAIAGAAHVVDTYAQRVVDGTIPAGKYHRLACARHLRDRAREGTAAFPYRFEAAKADRFFRFAAKLKHYKGEWAGQYIALQPWQQFRLGSFFGWVSIDTGFRRFRTAYNEVPRKNGKTLEAAIVGLYVTFYDGEPGAEGYCLATKRGQAMFVFNDMKKLVKASGLKAHIKIQVRNMHRLDTSSKLEPLGANPEDGLNPNLVIVDEYHKIKTRDTVDVMETAMSARRQPVSFQITTAGDDALSPCGEQHHYATQILDQVVDDETFFAFIAHADPDDDWTLDATAAKANPNYGVSVKPEVLRALVVKAIHMPGAAAAYQQDSLNWWVNTDAPWLSIDGWRAGQSTWSLEELRGEPCYAAIDLSSKIDLTALAFAFPPTETRTKWRYVVRCFTPADTLAVRAHRDRAPYLQWTELLIPGTTWPVLTTNPGNRIDQDAVRDAVNAAATEFDLRILQVGFDEWHAGNLEKDLDEDGYDVVEVPQRLKQMSAPSKEFEADVLDGLVDVGGNPLMALQASNVVVYRDGKDNLYPQKKTSRGRIDGIIACLIARKLAAIEEPEAEDPDLVVG